MMKSFFSISLLILLCSMLFTGCTKDEVSSSGSGEEDGPAGDVLPIHLTPAEYTSDNTYYLLNDNESSDVYFDNSRRSFYVNRPLQWTLDEEQNFQLRFYSPRALSNVVIWARIEGYDEEFRFMELEKIMPFQQLTIPLPFVVKDMKAYTRSGKQIQIMANPHISAGQLTFEVECGDPYYQKLQSIRCNWRITFSGYSGAGSWAYQLLPAHAREAVALALNMGYMYSSEEFIEELYAFGPLHSDNNKTVINKEELYNKIIGHAGLRFGHCTGVSGLGGGITYGLNEWCYLEHYADDRNETHAVFHEFGHCLGYGHNGNMTYEQTGPGWITLCANVYRSMSLNKELPVYSRRFMHTRRNKNRYKKDDLYVASKYIIEDPELDLLDGGLSPVQGETDQGGNEGESVTFKLDYTALPGAVATAFRPKDIYVYGDTLYVVNDADNNFSLEIFNIAGGNKRHIGSIREWNRNNVTETFKGRPNGVTRANGKIYVTHEGSRTEIFDAQDHRFITCIGNGNWGTGSTQTVHAFDVLVYKGLVFIHDKRQIAIAEEAGLRDGESVQIYARTENLGEAGGTYGMAVSGGLLYSTHAVGKRIDIFDPEDIRVGTVFKRSSQITCKNTPYALDFYEGRLFVSMGGTEKFCEIDPKTGEIIRDYTTIGNVTLKAPEKFCIRRNTLFIVDRVNEGSCLYAIPVSELE